MLFVRFSSPDPAMLAFPAACPAWLPDGCARVAEFAPRGVIPLGVLQLPASRPAVAAALQAWAASREAPSRGTLLTGSVQPSLLHFRFVSRFWGFADDTVLSLKCSHDGRTRVQAHSQLRLGRGDLGVNAARTRALWRHLNARFPDVPSAAAADGTCSDGHTHMHPRSPRPAPRKRETAAPKRIPPFE
jgi:hypothetical protein